MAILRKKGSLADLSAKLDRARGDLADVEARLTTAARERAEGVDRLAETYGSTDELVTARETGLSAEAALATARDALQEAVTSLEKRCAMLAEQESQERIAELRNALSAVASERSEAEAKLAGIVARMAGLEDEIDDAVDQARFAAEQFSTEAKAAAEGARKQERETINWLVRSGTRAAIEAELRDKPPRFRKLVEEAITEVDGERAERRERLKLDSAQSLAAVGLTVAIDEHEVRPGERFERIP